MKDITAIENVHLRRRITKAETSYDSIEDWEIETYKRVKRRNLLPTRGSKGQLLKSSNQEVQCCPSIRTSAS